MKKKKIWLLSFLILIVLSVAGCQYFRQQRVHNIFDEIFYEEVDYHTYTFLWNGRAFYKLEGMKYRDDSSDDFYRHEIKYTEQSLPDNISALSYRFFFEDYDRTVTNSDTELGVTMRLKLPNTSTTINFYYSYNRKNKTLERYMWYFDDKDSYYDQDHIEAFLAQHGKTIEEVRQEADQVMRDKLLKDWTSIYPSRFSPDNWGEVKLKDIWKDRG